MWHAVLHALEETIILLPFLFICYVLIELIETWTSRKTTKSLSKGKLQVLAGASVGLIPQCGFGVVATDLFSKKRIRMGALIAIYIATSDEAIPVILSNPDKISSLLPLLLFKFLFAILTGYIVLLFELKLEKKNTKSLYENANINVQTLENFETILEHDHEDNHDAKMHHDTDNTHEHDHDHDCGENIHIGCCGHEIEEHECGKNSKKSKLKHYLLHPFLHTLYIFSFILVINIVFSIIVHYVGEDVISNFMIKAKPLTPIFAVLVGLIPNCASSVILTNMYLIGSLPFGALLSGLIVNAGIAITVLFKQNKNIKQNLTILGVLVLTALIAGYGLLFLI